eukprot:TRINITY_DN17416_c0_g1_i2.p3 TRINITY_DN17416_c0_g1~~TRINITY_DN17416_c0_g1_i2.p3  ORF type:complete len:188 (+),score=46.73 TRINITY_DN17416_c0_g1_i2:439-1002(+)
MLLRRTGEAVVQGAVVCAAAESASYHSVLQDVQVSLRTNMLDFTRHGSNGNQTEAAADPSVVKFTGLETAKQNYYNEPSRQTGVKRLGSGGFFSSFLEKVWNGVKTLGSVAEKAVQAVAVVVQVVVTGDYDYANRWTSLQWRYNFNSATHRALGNTSIDAAVTCSNCYMYSGVDLVFQLDIQVVLIS